MKRVYQYKGFQIDVELEPVFTPGTGVKLNAPKGFLVVVQVKTATTGVPLFAPLRLTGDRANPFPTEAEALMAGFSAGQRMIDDTATV